MAKTYTKNTWTDEILAEAALHSITDSTGTPVPGNTTDIESVITALNALLDILSSGAKISLETDVVQAGTSIDATKMNNIENGIDALDDLIDSIKSKINVDTISELTISAGSITAVNGIHKLQPQSGTADDLDTIAGLSAGDLLILYAADTGTDTITLKHGTGNIFCPGGEDIELSNGAIIVYCDGTNIFVCGGGGSSDPTYLCQGRLTLESGVAISTAEQIDKTNVYFTPYNGNFLDLYDGTKWVRHTFTELTLAVGAFTASKPYDIFVYNNAGTLTLSATEWTNASTRATALALKDGIYVKNGAITYRYLGTIYIDAGQKCQDTLLKGYVWNYYNRVPRRFYMVEATAHVFYGAARLWNNSENNNRFDVVVGVADYIVINGLVRLNAGADASYAFAYFYIDGATPRYLFGNYNNQVVMGGSGMNIPMTAGYHYINVYEEGNHASSNFITVITYASLMR